MNVYLIVFYVNMFFLLNEFKNIRHIHVISIPIDFFTNQKGIDQMEFVH